MKRTRLTGSKSPRLVGASTPTSSEIPVTLKISGIPASTGEIPQQQKDITTDPSVTINTSIPEPAPSTVDSEGVTTQLSTAAELTSSSAPEIFYGPDSLPLPPGLIAMEEIVEDPPSSTPTQLGAGITLYPSSSENIHPPSEVPEDSLRNILDRLNMSEQLSTSRIASPYTATTEAPSAISTMFAGVPSVPASFQSLDGVHLGAILTVWTVPVCSSGIISGISYVESQQIDPSQGQFGQTGPQRQIIPLSTGLPSYGGPYTLSLPSLEGQPCVNS